MIKEAPMRRCIGCMKSMPQKELLRIAGYEGRLTIDLTGMAKGRGVYLCNNGDCLTKAIKRKAISRNIKIETTSEQVEKLINELLKYANKEEGVI